MQIAMLLVLALNELMCDEAQRNNNIISINASVKLPLIQMCKKIYMQ